MFAWSLLAIGAWATILVLARDGLKPALKLAVACGAVLLGTPRAARARHRLRPDRHASTPRTTSTTVGIASRRPYCVLAVRLPHGVPADPRRADRLARARPPAAARPGGDRDPRRDRVAALAGLHEGRDGAHLALPGPARVPRRGAARPPPDAAGRRARRAGRGLRAAVRHAAGELGRAPGEQPRVVAQRPVARRRRRRAESAAAAPRCADRSDPAPSAAAGRCTGAGARRQRARPDEAQPPAQHRQQQRQLTRARPLQRSARTRRRAASRKRVSDERPAVAAEPRSAARSRPSPANASSSSTATKQRAAARRASPAPAPRRRSALDGPAPARACGRASRARPAPRPVPVGWARSFAQTRAIHPFVS